jgi:hypothetical protein
MFDLFSKHLRRSSQTRSPQRQGSRGKFRPGLEALEDRSLPSTFTVLNTADSGVGSLRQAILNANAHPGVDAIAFKIRGAGLHTIRPASALPVVTDPVDINGYSQAGASPNTLAGGDNAVLRIELDGSRAGAANGLTITAGNSLVRGLIINRFSHEGISLLNRGRNRIEGNFLGTNAAGTLDFGNGIRGVFIHHSPANTIGGPTPKQRNLISGNVDGIGIEGRYSNASANVIQGNFIGTNVTGRVALGNDSVGLRNSFAANTRIGGPTAGDRNVISGNKTGIALGGSSGVVVEGNYIGVDVTGAHNLGNWSDGIAVDGNSSDTVGNRIGGPAPGQGNVIAGSTNGIEVIGAGAINNLIQGNLIGTDASGTALLGNSVAGVLLWRGASHNTIGSALATIRRDYRYGNVISGNGPGVKLLGGATDNLVAGNLIGTDVTGTFAIGNYSDGVLIDDAPNNTIGGATAWSRNLISGNGGNGVTITGSLASGNRILSNSIYANNGIGIDLDASGAGRDGPTLNDLGHDADLGANGLQNFPVLSAATDLHPFSYVAGDLHTKANTSYTLQFFDNAVGDPSGYGEGKTLIATTMVTTNAAGDVHFEYNFPLTSAIGHAISATATDPDGNTSEFSAAQEVRSEKIPPWLIQADAIDLHYGTLTDCLPSDQPQIYEANVSAPDPTTLLARKSIYYTSATEVDVSLLIPTCSAVSAVTWAGVAVPAAGTSSGIDGIGDRYYEVLSDESLSAHLHRVTIRLDFANLGMGSSNQIAVIVSNGYASDLRPPEFVFTLVQVRDVNVGTTADLNYSETELRNGFLDGVWARFGDGGYDPGDPDDDWDNLFDPSYDPTFDVEDDGIHFAWDFMFDTPPLPVYSFFDLDPDLGVHVEGRFTLEKTTDDEDGDGSPDVVKVVWLDDINATLDFPWYADPVVLAGALGEAIGIAFGGTVGGSVGSDLGSAAGAFLTNYIEGKFADKFQDDFTSSLAEQIQARVAALDCGPLACDQFVSSFETGHHELIAHLDWGFLQTGFTVPLLDTIFTLPELETVTFDVPYNVDNLKTPLSLGVALNAGDSFMVFANGLGNVLDRVSIFGLPGENALVGSNGLPDGITFRQSFFDTYPWLADGSAAPVLVEEAYEYLNGLATPVRYTQNVPYFTESPSILPVPGGNIGALAGRLGYNDLAMDAPFVIGNVNQVAVSNDRRARLALGANDVGVSSATYGDTLFHVTLAWFDTSGPRVSLAQTFVANDPAADTTVGYTSLKTVRVVFDEPIMSGSFTAADIVSFLGPDGLLVTVLGVSEVPDSDARSFEITFLARQSGAYSYVLGPNINDTAMQVVNSDFSFGNRMNQDNDGNNGESSQDRYNGWFYLGPPIAATPIDTIPLLFPVI